jgi:hypothetical protein
VSDVYTNKEYMRERGKGHWKILEKDVRVRVRRLGLALGLAFVLGLRLLT